MKKGLLLIAALATLATAGCGFMGGCKDKDGKPCKTEAKKTEKPKDAKDVETAMASAD